MKVTLNDIAEETGFSVSTVSRALRGIEKVSPKNKQIIIDTAKRLDYPLQDHSDGLSKRKNTLVALIVGFHINEGEFYASFFDGFMHAGEKRKMKVSMFNASSRVEEICDLIAQLDSTGYSAAVLMVSTLQREDYQQITDQTPSDFPLVTCSDIFHPVLSTVTFDGYGGGSLVANHFAEKGYNTAGVIEGPPNKPSAQYRKNGFADTINQTAGIELIWSYPGHYSIESGIQAFEDIETLDQKPRAVFAADDATALGFMEAARSHGYRFPEDIALASYDNLPICRYHFPTISSVKPDYGKLARVTLTTIEAQLFSHISHEEGLVSTLPVELVIRDSS
jgi:DNA-binding LacI/PurR family transcriptional regulator